jgi:putative Ca2+/H+ antiporter (TMEM165/GDT1 family)
MLHAFWVTYAAVFAAEILGDKFLYTTGILSTRYRTSPMMIGIAVAFMAKMAVAVAIGDALATVPRLVIAVVTMAGMIGIAFRFWRNSEPHQASPSAHSNSEAAMISCASVIFSEWADLGQMTAAAMAVQLRAPVVVWAGAVSAMVTKGLLIAVAGSRLRGSLSGRVPQSLLRYARVSLLVMLAVLSVIETLVGVRQ